jgi:HAD superfamily hydrolase (TIGR01490 family)
MALFTLATGDVKAMKLALFDFDGTITTRDSYQELLRYIVGDWRFFTGVAGLSPVLLSYKCGLTPNYIAKRKVTRWFLKGMTAERFELKAQEFVIKKLKPIVKASAIQKLEWHKEKGHRVILVSASFEDYLKYWVKLYNIEVIGTKLEWRNNQITGNFATPNCYGPEKVKRIKQLLDPNDYEEIFAYGDSRGDREMLALADHPNYRIFK